MRKYLVILIVLGLTGCRTTNKMKVSSELVADRPVKTSVSYEVEW